MQKQYNVPIKVLDPSREWLIQTSLQGYKVFSDEHGNLKDTCFSREDVPYVGEIIVVKTLDPDAARIAQEELSRLPGLLVLPTTTCSMDEDKARVREARKMLASAT